MHRLASNVFFCLVIICCGNGAPVISEGEERPAALPEIQPATEPSQPPAVPPLDDPPPPDVPPPDEPPPTPTPRGPFEDAQTDPLFNLGYLVCDYYGTNLHDGVTDATDALNACITDAYGSQTAAVLNTCGGVYAVTNSLVLYEWVAWNPANNRSHPPPDQAHTFRGRERAPSNGTCVRPTIKVKTCSPNFVNESAPRPVVAYRSFEAIAAGACMNVKPAHPLGMVANCQDGGAVYFSNSFHNIDIDTNGCDGAIGLTSISGQSASISNTKITATGSYAGIYGTPGRNGVVGNVEVIGGNYGVLIGSYPNLGSINPQQGSTLNGFKASGQTVATIRVSDPVPLVVVGFEITKSSNGPAIVVEGGGLSLIDGKITMNSDATNDVVVNNTAGWNTYSRSVYVTGSNQIFQFGSGANQVISVPQGSGSWARVVEYAATDRTNMDGVDAPGTYPNLTNICTEAPTYPCRFEARSVINGTLAGGGVSLSNITASNTQPPNDLHSRHVWATPMPSVWDTPICVRPHVDFNAVRVMGLDYPSVSQNTFDSAPAINNSIQLAADQGHNRVCLGRGSYVIGSTLNVQANTKFIGAGHKKNAIVSKSTWNPTVAVPMIETADSATGTAQMNFFTLWHKVTPFANDFIHHLKWRTGKNSSAFMLDLASHFLSTCQGATATPTNKQRNAVWLTGNGGGRFWMIQQGNPTNLDRHVDSRVILLDGNTQPTSFYGNNVESGKGGPCGVPKANLEVKNNTAGVRSYGSKREGRSPTVLITNSSNVGVFSHGAMVEPPTPAVEAYNLATASSDNYVIGPITVRQNKQLSELPIFKISGGASYIEFPNGASVIKKGTLDDTPFGSGGAPPVTAPELSTIIVDTPDEVDIKFTINDGAALKPDPPTGATGLTFTVDGIPKTPTGAVLRVGNDTYRALFPAGTIISQPQVVLVTYVPGNITGGVAPNPPAPGFTNFLATNTLPPGNNPVFSQTGFMFRQIGGSMSMDGCNSPPYQSLQGTFENAPGYFLPNSEFRAHLQAAVNNAAAPTQALSICWERNESGTFALLTNDCTADKTCFTDAPDLADMSPTLQQLTPSEATFVPGGLVESATTQINVTLPQNSETVYEAAIRLAGATVGHRYRYRLCKTGGAPLDSYPAANVALVNVISQRSEGSGGRRQ